MDFATAQKEHSASESVKAALRTTPTWRRDLLDPTVYIKLYQAAVAAGTPAYIVRHALGELRAEAVILTEMESEENSIGRIDWEKVEGEIGEHLGKADDGIQMPFVQAETDASVPTVFSADHIPASLHDLLALALSNLAMTSQPKFPPLQTGKIQNIIDPNLYPFIHETTYVPPPATITPTTSASAPYQWLPTTVHISATGQAHIASPINNLPRLKYQTLYKALEHFITLCLPTWERSLPNIPLTNTALQVIFAAESIILPPLQTYSSPYHHSGLPHESIALSSIYTYSSSPEITNHGTSLRYRTANPPCPTTIELGTLSTPKGTLLTHANTLQTRITGLKNTSSTLFAQHKTLTLHLVTPTTTLPSTQTIPRQQTYEQSKPLLYPLLQSVADTVLGPYHHFCTEVAGEIIRCAKWGVTEEEAMVHRWRCCAMRNKFVESVNAVWDGESDEEED